MDWALVDQIKRRFPTKVEQLRPYASVSCNVLCAIFALPMQAHAPNHSRSEDGQLVDESNACSSLSVVALWSTNPASRQRNKKKPSA